MRGTDRLVRFSKYNSWSRMPLNSQPNRRFSSAYSSVPVFPSFTLLNRRIAN